MKVTNPGAERFRSTGSFHTYFAAKIDEVAVTGMEGGASPWTASPTKRAPWTAPSPSPARWTPCTTTSRRTSRSRWAATPSPCPARAAGRTPWCGPPGRTWRRATREFVCVENAACAEPVVVEAGGEGGRPPPCSSKSRSTVWTRRYLPREESFFFRASAKSLASDGDPYFDSLPYVFAVATRSSRKYDLPLRLRNATFHLKKRFKSTRSRTPRVVFLLEIRARGFSTRPSPRSDGRSSLGWYGASSTAACASVRSRVMSAGHEGSRSHVRAAVRGRRRREPVQTRAPRVFRGPR